MKINRTPSPTPSQPAPCNQAQIINKKYLPLGRNALWDWRYPRCSFGLTCPNSPNIPSSCGGSVVLDTSVCDHRGEGIRRGAAILQNTSQEARHMSRRAPCKKKKNGSAERLRHGVIRVDRDPRPRTGRHYLNLN